MNEHQRKMARKTGEVCGYQAGGLIPRFLRRDTPEEKAEAFKQKIGKETKAEEKMEAVDNRAGGEATGEASKGVISERLGNKSRDALKKAGE